jgi:hypothetical protein
MCDNQRWIIAHAEQYVQGWNMSGDDKRFGKQLSSDFTLQGAEQSIDLGVRAYWYGYHDRTNADRTNAD